MIKKTIAEKRALKLAKKDHKLSLQTDVHEDGRQKILRAVFDGITECNFGELRITSL